MGAESYPLRYSEPACCRNCGKPGGAIMMSGGYGHDHWTCSEACAIRLGHKLRHGMGQPKYDDPPDGLQGAYLASLFGRPVDQSERILNLRIRIKQLEHRVKERDSLISYLEWMNERAGDIIADQDAAIGELIDETKRAEEHIRDLECRDY